MVILFLTLGHFVFAFEEEKTFQHLCVENGLSQSTVFAIYKDQKEFMWFGTRRGLNMYDGYEFKHFMHEIDDSNSLTSNIILTIIGDKKDNLIIQTENHINYFDRYKNKFSVIPSNEKFRSFVKDWDNNIWACSDSGLYRLNETTNEFTIVKNKIPFRGLFDLAMGKENNLWITNTTRIIQYNIANKKYKIFEIPNDDQITEDIFIDIDMEGKIWICLRNGKLYYFDKEKQSFINYIYDTGLDNMLVSSFNKGMDNTILIGTDGSGLIQLNTKTGKIDLFNHIPDKEGSLSSNTIYSIYTDNKLGILWLGSYMGGIDFYSRYNKGFRFIYHQPYNKKSIVNSNIRSLFIDSDKRLWVGTRQGISLLDSLDKPVRQFNQQSLLKEGIQNPIITKIFEDPSGYIWICTYKGGVVLYDPFKETIIPVKHIYPHIELPSHLGVFDVLVDRYTNFWFATDEGTYLFLTNKKGFIFHEDFSKDIIEDRAGRIFIGTSYNGLLHVNNHTLQIQPVSFSSLESADRIKRINTMLEDINGDIWIGTGGSGIVKYNPSTGQSIHFTKDNGLPDDNIAGIIQDKNAHIWVTTYSGLSRYSKDNNTFKHVFLEQGIKGKEFNPNSISISSKGIFYAGSVNGLLSFNINNYRENPYLPDVIFTELYINNKLVNIGQKKAPIENTIMFSKKINLSYFQNSFALKFTAPTYYLGNKVRFYYRFGEDPGYWTNIGNHRSLNFVDLKPGEYTLHIKAENSDGYSKNKGTVLFIHVDPPPWKTKLAYVIYAMVIIAIVLLLRMINKSRMNLKYQVLLQKAEKEKLEEINQARVRLFTDVSYEIGTSLTLINVPLDVLTRIEDEELKKHHLAIINKNVLRLMHLVKRIIGLRKIETGNMPLTAEKDDIVSFIKTICTNYESMARRKNIKFLTNLPFGEIITWFDKEKVESILYNLLSNALKFEPENGTVCVSLAKEMNRINRENRKVVSLKVNNEGSTISKEKAKNIFNRFYTGKESAVGSGIGLSLTKSYVDIHKGEINLYSDEKTGVTFEVRLPFGESYLEPNEKLISGIDYEMKMPFYLEPKKESPYIQKDELLDNEKGKILIVEDNIDLMNLLKEQLIKDYQIIEASDGEEGFIKAKNLYPDLVITDLKMQNMNGLDLCRSIKKDIDTEHIPVIILTAKDDIEEQIKGMEAGADTYITKPFQLNYLHSVIFNLIELRKKLKKKYHSTAGIANEAIEIKSMDENFLEKAYRKLEENLDNIQFGIPEFIEQLGVSKYMLYSKIKNLTGQTPNEFIITYRLKKAAQILKSKDISDIDLYFRVGFNDVSYFRKCFKRHFGMTPHQFVRSNRFKDEK